MKMIVKINKSARFGRKSRDYVKILSTAVMLLGLSINVLGQSKADRVITGMVLDQNHAAIAGARVTAAGKVVASSFSGGNGEFSLPLEPGQYELRIEAEGFATVVRSLDVPSAEAERIEIVLEIATATAKAGAQVALVPHHTFSIWNKYQIISKLAVGIGVVHRSDMFAAIDNAVILPAYTRIDAAVYVPLTEKWRLQANVENLANSRYYLTADGNNNVSPGSRRAVRASIITRF